MELMEGWATVFAMKTNPAAMYAYKKYYSLLKPTRIENIYYQLCAFTNNPVRCPSLGCDVKEHYTQQIIRLVHDHNLYLVTTETWLTPKYTNNNKSGGTNLFDSAVMYLNLVALGNIISPL